MKVWVAVVEHRHGQNVYAARTKRSLVDQLYAYVQEGRDSEIPDEAMPSDLSKRKWSTGTSGWLATNGSKR